MKADKRQKIIYEMFRDRLELPVFFPLIRFFMVDDECIYVISYEQKDHLHKCVNRRQKLKVGAVSGNTRRTDMCGCFTGAG